MPNERLVSPYLALCCKCPTLAASHVTYPILVYSNIFGVGVPLEARILAEPMLEAESTVSKNGNSRESFCLHLSTLDAALAGWHRPKSKPPVHCEASETTLPVIVRVV